MNKENQMGRSSGTTAGRNVTEDFWNLFDMPTCGGCRTCELACSFHHTKEFIPSASSLKVLAREDKPGYQILLIAESSGESIACDGCKGLDVPLCMEYCKEMDDLGKILLIFEEKKTQIKK